MSFAIVIGDATQPTSGFGIVIGDSGGGAILDFTVPTASIGTVLLIVVVRDDAIVCSDSTWTKVIDGEGTSDIFLDAWSRIVDGTTGSNPGDVVSFLSLTEQELQGSLLKVTNADEGALVYDVEHAEISADTTPNAPAIDAIQDFDTVVCVYSANDTVTLTAPSGFDEVDVYSSSVVAERTLLVAERTTGATGTITPDAAGSSPAATGRAFSIALHHIAAPPGPTLAAMATGSISSKWIAAIEGYRYLLTDAATDAAVDAWDDTGYTEALGGLYVRPSHEQRINPWNAFENTGGRLTLQVAQSNTADTFGVDTHIKTGGVATLATASVDCDDATLTVKSAASFDEEGTLYIGTEACGYTGTTATSFTGLTRGKYSPFRTDDDSDFAHPHTITQDDSTTVSLQPVVSNKPRSWLGKWVGLWRHLHDAQNGLLNVKADALCTFAGRIVEVRDNPATMTTDVEVEHVLEHIANAVIGENPWTAEIVDGITLVEGQTLFSMAEFTGVGAVNEPDPLIVIAEGATPANAYEWPAGRHSISTIRHLFNNWADQAQTDGDIDGVYRMHFTSGADGLTHTRFSWQIIGSGTFRTISVAMPYTIHRALGTWANATSPFPFGHATVTKVSNDGNTHTELSVNEVLRSIGETVELANEFGTFFDQATSLPTQIAAAIPILIGSNEAGVCVVEGLGDEPQYFVILKDGDELVSATRFDIATGQPSTEQGLDIPFSHPTNVKLRQVVILRDTFANLMLKLFASTGTTGFNHATYDAYPAIIGLAIPWTLLGEQFETSVKLLSGADVEMTLVIDKAYKLVDLLGNALKLRFAFLRWINGGLQFWQWMTPTTGDALEEGNKASPAGTADEQRSVSTLSDSWARNLIKIDFNRSPDLGIGDAAYTAHATVIDRAAIDDAGGKKATLTIADPTSFAAGFLGGNANIDAVISDFVSIAPMFTRPVRTSVRTIAPTFFEGYSVGDCVLVTDEYARDPGTGARGVSTRPGIIVAHSYEPGGFDPTGAVGDMHGEVEVMFLDNLKTGPYVPCADVDEGETNGGLDAATETIFTCHAHHYSMTGEAADASHMSAGRKIRIVQIDPEDPAAPLSWDRTVASQTGNTVTVTAAIASPAWDSALSYRIIWDDYSDAIPAQQVYSYQADDADGLVSDAREPFQYTANTGQLDWPNGVDDANDADDPVELPPDSSYGDGVGLDVGTQVAVSRLLTNLYDFKTGRSNPILVRTPLEVNGDVTHEWQVVLPPIPIFLGNDILGNAVRRKLYVAPHWKSNGGATVDCRITLCKQFPTGGGQPPFAGTFSTPYVQVTFTTTSTTYATPTEQALDIGTVKDFFGLAYVVLEMRVPTASGSEIARCYGIATCYEGARE